MLEVSFVTGGGMGAPAVDDCGRMEWIGILALNSRFVALARNFLECAVLWKSSSVIIGASLAMHKFSK
jgi:hypothetical protein